MSAWATLAALFAAAFVASMIAAARGRATKVVGVLAGLMALGCGWIWWNHTRTEARLSAAATEVAGVEVHVDCQEPFLGELLSTPRAGRVDARSDGTLEDVARLNRRMCAAANSWPDEDSDDAYIAVHVLTHEAGHVRGERNEAATECWAMRNSALVAQELGASRQQAERRARWYHRAIYPRLSDSYRGGGCDLDGG